MSRRESERRKLARQLFVVFQVNGIDAVFARTAFLPADEAVVRQVAAEDPGSLVGCLGWAVQGVDLSLAFEATFGADSRPLTPARLARVFERFGMLARSELLADMIALLDPEGVGEVDVPRAIEIFRGPFEG
jgi:hypothetical protein